MHDPNRAAARDDDEEEEAGLDISFVFDYLGYVFRAIRLRPALVLGIFVGFSTLAFLVVRALPRTYHVESKLLVQRDANLGHGNPWGTDPLKGASDIVMAHDHLVSVVKQLELVPWWRQHLVALQRAKAWVSQLTARPPTEEEQVRMIVDILSKNMQVSAGDGTVTFALDWPDAEMAARLVDTVEQNFLEKRHVIEISTIAESVSILEEHAAKARKEIEELAQSRPDDAEQPGKGAASPPGSGAPVAAPAPRNPTPATAGAAPRRTGRRSEMEAELAGMKVMIEAKQRAISELEGFRQRRILDLQANLSEQRSKYTDAHPIIVGIQQNIASISSESPQVVALRSEVKSLQETYDRTSREAEAEAHTGGGGGGSVAAAAPSAQGASEIAGLVNLVPKEQRSPAVDAQIGNEIAKFAEIRTQISTARIELDLAQAAFRYRYSVVTPAEPPVAPIKPKATLMIAAATLGSLVLGMLAAVIAELRVGRVVHRWQVERNLGLPVLAEVRLPAPRRDDRA